MTGLDTNVLVRYIIQDDPAQAKKATALIEGLTEEAPGFVPLVAVVELVWVLQGSYAATRKDIFNVLEALLQSRTLAIEQAETVAQAVRVYAETNADFADCLLERSARAAKCGYTATFDKKAAKAAGMRLID